MSIWTGIKTTATTDYMGGLTISDRSGQVRDSYLQPGDEANEVITILEGSDLEPEGIDGLLLDYLPEA